MVGQKISPTHIHVSSHLPAPPPPPTHTHAHDTHVCNIYIWIISIYIHVCMLLFWFCHRIVFIHCFALYFRTFRWHLCFNCVGQVSTASLPERVYGCWAVWLAHRSGTGRRQGGGGGLRTTTVAGRSHRTCHRGAPLPAQPLLLQICGCWGCWLLEVAFGDCWLFWLAVTGLLGVLTGVFPVSTPSSGSDRTAGCANWWWPDCWVCWLAVTSLLHVLTGGDRTAGCAGWRWLLRVAVVTVTANTTWTCGDCWQCRLLVLVVTLGDC